MSYAVNSLFSFGDFRIDRDHRLLLRKGAPVALKPKTFDLLLALVENRGQLLTKNDLLDKVWENQFVEENNLTVHVAALRKALGETSKDNKFIATVPGKGYQFVAELQNGGGGEIVVERRKFERIVVDEEIEETTGASASQRAPASSGWLNGRRAAVIASALILAALSGGYAFRARLAGAFAASAPVVEHRMRQLTTNGKVGLAALSPDGKLFAYTIDVLGQKSLWLGFVDGGNHIELRPPAEATFRSLTFSHDGRDLIFSLSDERNSKPAVYRMPAFGGVQTKLLDDVSDFSLSPDSRSIATIRRDPTTERDVVVVAPLDGTESRDVTSFSKELSVRFDTLSWSADGKRLAISVKTEDEIAANELAVIEIATGETTRIKHQSLREITKTAWLHDGSGLIVTAIDPASDSSVPQYVIYRVSYPGGELQPITADRSNYGASWHNDAGVSISLSAASDGLLAVEHRQLSNVWVAPSDDFRAARQITFGSFGKYDGLWGMDWTPDGRLIYTTSDTQSQYLSQMNSDGSGQKQLTAPAGFDSVLTVGADGRYVFFHSDRTSTVDIWRTDIDGTNPLQLTFGGKGFHPAPSPDGKWVYYKSRLNGGGGIWRVPVDGGEPESVTDKETSWMSFSPDGRYLAASHIADKYRLAIFSAETHEIIKQFDLPKTGTLYMGSRWTPDSKAVTYRDNSYGYWIQPIDGGEPRRMEGLPQEKLYNFAWSKDGKWFAFVRGQEIRDVVLLTNTAP